MNNKGFTLTELLAVIAILGVISTIAGFSYSKIMKDNKVKQCEQKILYIEKQAIKYVSDNNILHNKAEGTLTISELVEKKYLNLENDEKDDINPLTEETFDQDITIKKNNGNITAEYGGKCE